MPNVGPGGGSRIFGGVVEAREKSAIDNRTGQGLSVGKGRSVRVGVCLRIGRDEDISDAAR